MHKLSTEIEAKEINWKPIFNKRNLVFLCHQYFFKRLPTYGNFAQKIKMWKNHFYVSNKKG